MPYLKKIIHKFDSNKGHPIERTINVLDMIEHSISYPSCKAITDEEIIQVELRIEQLLPELKDNPVLAGRIDKWWKNRGNCQSIARLVRKRGHDNIDSLLYHGDIISIRKTRMDLMMLQKGEKSNLEDHGLFGTKYHHTKPSLNLFPNPR